MKKLRVLTEAVSQQFKEYYIDIPEDWEISSLTKDQLEDIKTSAFQSGKGRSHKVSTVENLVGLSIIDPNKEYNVPQLANIEVVYDSSKIPTFGIYNLDPTYLKSPDIISEESAKFLTRLVDDLGTPSDWTGNPNTLEFQLANPYNKNRNIDNPKYKDILFELNSIAEIGLRHIDATLRNSSFDRIVGHHGFWIMRYAPGGEFPPHCDLDSGHDGITPPVAATLAILLNDEFTGGDFILYDSCHNKSLVDTSKVKYEATVWDSLTYHQVTKIESGYRYMLVIHYIGADK